MSNDEYDVPAWEHTYIYDLSDLRSASASQKDFYKKFKKKFMEGEYLDLKGFSNYVFTLLFDLAEMPATRDNYYRLVENLSRLSEQYTEVKPYTEQVLHDFSAKFLKKENTKIINSISAQNSATKGEWIHKGETIVIAGRSISKGLFYVGDFFEITISQAKHFCSDPQKNKFLSPVINPKLIVSDGATEIGPFSSYSTMTETMRAQYIDWLSGNVGITEIYIDSIYLYVLGMEVRFFIDSSCTDKDKNDIIVELCSLYDEMVSNGLKDATSYLKQNVSNMILRYSPENTLNYLEKKYLFDFQDLACRAIKDMRGPDKRITKEKAFEIADEYFSITKLAPAGNEESIRNEFYKSMLKPLHIFSFPSSEYDRDQFSLYQRPCGMHLTSKLFVHDCESLYYISSYRAYDYASYDDYYTITDAVKMIIWSFSKYNNLVEANEGKTTPYVIMNYPDYIDASQTPQMIELKSWIEEKIDASGFCIVSVMDFIERISYPTRNEKGIYKLYAQSIESSIQKLGYGMAPSPHIEGDRLMYDGFCCFYKLSGTYSPRDVNKGQTIVKMAIQVATADNLRQNDIILINESLTAFGYNDSTLKYLSAYLRQYTASAQKSFTPKNLEDFSMNDLQTLYKLLLRMIFNGGEISDKRVKVLKKYCKVLGQDPDKIHSSIHEVMTDSEFATVEKTTGAVSYSIPKPSEVVNTFAIDNYRLERMEKKTKEAQEMLSDIFTDDEATQEKKPMKENNVIIEILKILLQKDVWDYQDVDKLCKEKGQMTGFVLEKINDYSYEKVDDAFIDQDGVKLYITTEYKEQLI